MAANPKPSQFLGEVPIQRPTRPMQLPENKGTADIILQAAGLDRQDAALKQRASEAIGESMQAFNSLMLNIGKKRVEEKQAEALLQLKKAADMRENESLGLERKKVQMQEDALKSPPTFGKTPGGSEYAIHRGEFKFSPTAEKVAGMKAGAKTNEKASSVGATFRLYETARDGLMAAMSKTKTGPGYGLIPGITAAQQEADSAAAAMAPVLKQLFRVAGEGVFTDRDQELLMKMVATRKMHPDAALANSKNIDNIVKAKLGITTRQLKDGSTVLVRKLPGGGYAEVE